MKKSSSIIGIIVIIISAILYISSTFLGIDLIEKVDPDDTAPHIDISGISTTVEMNEIINYDSITCTDNRDSSCEIEIFGTIDTSTAGTKSIVVSATDSKGNNTQETIYVEVLADEIAPVINLSAIGKTVQLDGTIQYDLITCTDNVDDTCEIEIFGEIINTSVAGEQSFVVMATDSSGNKTQETVHINVIEGLDTTKYVPLGYYDSINGLTGENLKSNLNDIITNHIEFPYTDKDPDVWDMLRAADEDPNNSDNVILFYSGYTWPKECQDTLTSNLPDYCFVDNNRNNDYTEWNREHIWSKSHGDFEEEDDYAFEESSGGKALGAHTDGHHLVAAERRMNSIKNNRFFSDCHDGIEDDNLEDRGYGNYTCGEWYFEPRDEVKGDVARMLFYMAVRYEGEDGDYIDLELTSDFDAINILNEKIKDSKIPYYADLDILLRWHLEDPVSEWEVERNQTIYEFQGNRNPFIDMPELVEMVFGTEENPINYIAE